MLTLFPPFTLLISNSFNLPSTNHMSSKQKPSNSPAPCYMSLNISANSSPDFPVKLQIVTLNG